MAQTYNRWWDNVGDDPVDRQTSTALVRAGTVFAQPRSGMPNTVPPAAIVLPVSVPPSPAQLVPPVRAQSKESGIAPFETLFHELDLEAIPYYNFWEQDEEHSGHPSGRDFDELPRFIKLAWEPAPDLPDPDVIFKRGLLNSSPDARTEFFPLSPFGFGGRAVVASTANGVKFTPANLQPAHFRENAAKCANGYLCSGIFQSVISARTSSITSPRRQSTSLLNEDQYLADDEVWWGISYPEANASLWRQRSSVYGLQSSPAVRSNDSLFAGQYGLASPLSDGITMLAAAPDSPAISYAGRTAAASRSYPQNRLQELAGPYLTMEADQEQEHSVRVWLVHTNVAGAMDPQRVAAITKIEHAESIIAVAQAAADMAAYAKAGFQHYAKDVSIPSDPAPNTIKPLEYVGYMIEKWELVSGSYQLIDTIYIPGREYDAYIDGRVKYGTAYRYRIRSIIRWSRPHGVGVMGKDPTVRDGPGVNFQTLTPNDVSYFHSEWGAQWAHAQVIDRVPPNPPDELTVRPVSADGYIEVTFKLPGNEQRDINSMTLYRKVVDEAGVERTGWMQVHEFLEDLSDPARQGTRDVLIASFQHEQDDITGTKFVARERERTETFVEYGPVNARFEDHDIVPWGGGETFKYVYAAVCRTRHGETSVLSDQLAARLNPDWKRTGEFPTEFVSCAGVHMDFDTGPFSTYPERRARHELVIRPDLKLGVHALLGVTSQERRSRSLLQPGSYVLRVESLDNGQRVDVPVEVGVQNVSSQTVQQAAPAGVVRASG